MATPTASGAGASDPLRRTLDTLHLDPNAAQDRPYLESMLRRLGYSETEIQAYLGRDPKTLPPPAAASVATDAGDDRVIEVEYTGPGLKEFKLAIGVDESELPAIQAGEAGTEVFEAGPSMEEVDRLAAEGGGFDDWGGEAVEGGAASEAEDLGALDERPEGVEPEGDVVEGEVAGDESAALGEEAAKADFNATEGGPEAVQADEAGEDFQTGESLVEFKSVEFNEPAAVQVVDPQAAAEALKAEGWEVADAETGEFEIATWEEDSEETGLEESAAATGWQETGGEDEGGAQAAEAGPFQYKDWTLYSRDELRGDQPQRIYFFSKGSPEGSDPAAMPDGYEVAENPDTGRPFLRRSQESSGFAPAVDTANPNVDTSASPKKRVRIQRVRAASREEAIAKLQAEGRNVIASMPIDIEKRFGE